MSIVRQVELFEGRDGQWYWRLEARNGETLAHSEGYTRKWSAKRTARLVAQGFGAPLVIQGEP